MSHANPDVRPVAYQVIDRPSFERAHGKAFLILGHVGDASDAQRMEEILLRRYRGTRGYFDRRSVNAIILALGVMSHRGISHAAEILDRMSDIVYWERVQAGVSPKELVLSKADLLREVMLAQGIAREENLERWRAEILRQLHLPDNSGGNFALADLGTQVRNRWMVSAQKPSVWERKRLDEAGQSILESLARDATPSITKHTVRASVTPALPLDDARERVEAGDASVVAELRKWLAGDVTPSPASREQILIAASEGLAAFQDRSVLERLKTLLAEESNDRAVRSAAAAAIATLSSRDELELLKDITWDERLSMTARAAAAEALARLDDDLGYRFLLEQYDLYRLERVTRNQWGMDPVREALERMGDERVIAALRERMPTETNPTMKRNIATLIERMLVNAQPLTVLREFAADTSWLQSYRRYAAIEVLGAKGDPETIPFLQSLQPFRDPNYPQAQAVNFPRAIRQAVGHIRRRHWQPTAEQTK